MADDVDLFCYYDFIRPKPPSLDQLPREFWAAPRRPDKRYPVRLSRAEVLARAEVTEKEVQYWHGNKWLSDAAAKNPRLSPLRACEIAFVRDLARSGLGESQISRLLLTLPAPYVYDPDRMAYSFRYGWVMVPGGGSEYTSWLDVCDACEIVNRNFDFFLAEMDDGTLRYFRDRIQAKLGYCGLDGDGQ